MALSVPANAGFLAVETTAPKTVIIPLSTDLVGRVITIKDKSGSASTNPITLSLQGVDTFENGATTYVINEDFGSATIVSSNGIWLFQQTSQVSLANWANYQAVSSIQLNSSQPNIINPSPIAAAVFQTNTLVIADGNNAPTGLNLGYLTFQTSTSQDFYTFINDVGATNTVSSLSLIHGTDMGSLYLSSIYLGNLGGTIYGELTTDDTATNLFWKGTQINGAVGAVTTGELVSTVDNLAQVGYISTSQLVSTILEWSRFPAVSPITLFDNNASIINPVNGTAVNIQTAALSVADVNQAPGVLDIGTLNFLTSTSQDSYTIGNDSFFTGTVSSLAIVLPKQNETRSLYLSSLYLGGFGGVIYGELTTDETGTNLFWKGTQINGAVGAVTTAELVSTVADFQTDFKTQTISSGNIQISTVNLLDIYTNDINFLTVSTGTLLLNGGYITGSGGSAVSQLIAGTGISLAPPGGTGAVTITNTINTSGLVSTANLSNLVSTSYLETQLVSTVAGLSNSGYVIESELFSTTAGLVLPVNLISTVAGLGNTGYISSTQLTSTTVGTFDYVSSYFSTYIRNIPIIYSGETLFLNYSVSGPVSPYKQLTSSNIIGPSFSDIYPVPSNSINNFVVGFQTDFALPSFIPTGLWTASLFCQAADTTVSVYATLFLRDSGGTETVIGSSSNSPFIVPTTKVRLDMILDAPYTDIPSGGSIVLKFFVNNTKNQIVNFTSFYEDGNYSYVRTTFGILIAQPIINSTVAGLGQAGYVSTSQLVSTVAGLGNAGYVSTANLLNLVSTSYLQTQFVSTVDGLSNAGYVIESELFSTTAGLVLPVNLVSTVAGLSNAGYVIESELFSTTAGLVLPVNLVSTVAGLSSVAVTQIVAGSNITISPVGGVGVVTINGSASGLTTIPANLSTSALFTSSALASTISARSISTGFITLSSATFFDPLSANTGNSLAVANTFLYFNNYIIGGTRVASQQWVVF